MNVVVLAGGLSPERDVSLSSGSLIANALIKNGHNVVLLDVYKGIKLDTSNKDYSSLFVNRNDDKVYSYVVPDKEPDLEKIRIDSKNGESLIGENVIEICKYADIVFIALHGAMGENGQIQATFDTLGIKYTGSGYVGSLLAMDKDITKRLLKQQDIPTANWVLFDAKKDCIKKIIDNCRFPVVVKPCNNGSSIGVFVVNNTKELEESIKNAKTYEDLLIIEEFVKGREFSIGIIGEKVLPPIEIIPKQGFYDYKNKYQKGLTEEICPAKITEQQLKRMKELALKVHNTLRLKAYSRIDFILNDDNEFICLEANTLPGMTPTSLLPQEADTIGIEYGELCEEIIHLSM